MAAHRSEQQLGYFRHYRTRRGDQLRLVRMARGAAPVCPPGVGSPVNRCRPLTGGAGRQRFTWRQAAEVVVGVVVLVGLWAGVAFWMAIVEAGRFGWTQ